MVVDGHIFLTIGQILWRMHMRSLCKKISYENLIGFDEGFCDCGAGNISCRCLCYDKNSKGNYPAFIPGPCIINKTGENFVHQNFYRCIACNYSDDLGCCEIWD